MAIRVSLGATKQNILRLIFGQSAAQTAIGLGIGLALAAGVSQLLAGMMFSVNPRDPLVFLLVVVVVVLVGVVATVVPGWRAASTDPMSVVR